MLHWRTLLCGIAMMVAINAVAHARNFEMGGDNDYPNSIIAPEHGAPGPRHTRVPVRVPNVRRSKARAEDHPGRKVRENPLEARGSSVLIQPTPLPRTPLIPPEGGGVITTRVPPQEQAPSIVPGLRNPVPNLPHGVETFQDRASRCSFQAGLYGVPGGKTTQYIGTCVQQ